jgi:hypothetical protein
MSRYDDDDDDNTKKTEGKVVAVKKNKTGESSSGKEFSYHLLVIETKDGDEKKFKISKASRAAKFVADLEEGQKVTVQTGGKFKSVQAVFVNDRKGGRSGGGAKFNNDPTGAIQGNTRTNATQLVTSGIVKVGEDGDVVKALIEAAKILIKAGVTIDDLVAKAQLKKAKAKDEDDEDSDDDEDEKPKKKKKKKKEDDDSDEDEKDNEDEEDSPY